MLTDQQFGVGCELAAALDDDRARPASADHRGELGTDLSRRIVIPLSADFERAGRSTDGADLQVTRIEHGSVQDLYSVAVFAAASVGRDEHSFGDRDGVIRSGHSYDAPQRSRVCQQHVRLSHDSLPCGDDSPLANFQSRRNDSLDAVLPFADHEVPIGGEVIDQLIVAGFLDEHRVRSQFGVIIQLQFDDSGALKSDVDPAVAHGTNLDGSVGQ